MLFHTKSTPWQYPSDAPFAPVKLRVEHLLSRTEEDLFFYQTSPGIDGLEKHFELILIISCIDRQKLQAIINKFLGKIVCRTPVTIMKFQDGTCLYIPIIRVNPTIVPKIFDVVYDNPVNIPVYVR